MMSSCFFCLEDHCIYRDVIEYATEGCEFMDKDRKCTAKESDLVNMMDIDFLIQEES